MFLNLTRVTKYIPNFGVFRQLFTSLMHNIYENVKDLHFNIHGFDQVKAKCDLETHIIWVIYIF